MASKTRSKKFDHIKLPGDHLLIRPLEHEELTPGGIVLPESTSKKGVRRGEVLKTGPGRAWSTGGVAEVIAKPGDIAVFEKGLAGNDSVIREVELEGEKLLVAPEGVVLLYEESNGAA